VLDIWIDITKSVDGKARSAALENLAEQLPGIIAKRGICRILIYSFGQRAWVERPKDFKLPNRHIVTCRPPNISGDIPLPVATELKKQAEEKCRDQRARAEQEDAAELRNA